MDKLLYKIEMQKLDTLKDIITLQDATSLLNDEDIKAGVKTQMLEKINDLSKEDLEIFTDTMQQMRQTGATGYPKYSDSEMRKYYSLDVLFSMQEQLEHLESEKLEERKEIIEELSNLEDEENEEVTNDFAQLNPVEMPTNLANDEDIMKLSNDYFTALKELIDGSSATIFRSEDEVLK